MKKKLFLFCLLLMGGLRVYAQSNPQKTVTDADIKGDVHWYADTTYVLQGFVFVEDGETLTIDAGTVIKGSPGQAANASALIVARGGKIYATGTAQKPIIFTALSDDVTDPNDMDPNARGLWGGVILLGKGKLATAPNSNGVTTDHIEGIPETEPRGEFGGNDDNDDSGVLRYVSIRYGGTALSPGNEINGLTLGGVGSKTVIDYVEMFNIADDGVEIFGGKPQLKHMVSAFNTDDAFDYDEGFRGKGQFWFAVMPSIQGLGNRGGEHDGGNNPTTAEPHSDPQIYNATYIGGGATSGNTENDLALIFRDDAAGAYYNSIFTDFANKAISVEDLTSGVDSRQRLESGDLVLQNNIWYGFGAGSTLNDFVDQDFVRSYLSDAANNNTIEDPMIASIDRTQGNHKLDPRPEMGSPAFTGSVVQPPQDQFYQQVDYKGAFAPGDLWIKGWTALSQLGYLPQEAASNQKPTRTITDADIVGDAHFYADTTYILSGFVFVEDGETLTIDPGTVIKGSPGQAANASALIVARGGKIYANGTNTQPIIFTALADNVDDPKDMDPNARGLWGGVILLGKGKLATAPNTNGVTTDHIEGIPETEPRGEFGGNNDDDDSGVLRYVSIRYGGTALSPGNEINGLTLGGVGSKTTIEYVEMFNTADDGVEIFGGKPQLRYMISAFNTDDAFDYDEGFRGKGQFWFAVMSSTQGLGNRGGEHDGGNNPTTAEPHSDPQIYNATYIRGGATSGNTENDLALIFRDDAAGAYYNSIFTDFANKGIQVEDLTSGVDSRQRLESGDLVLQNNIWYGFGAGNTLTDFVDQDFVRSYLSNPANGNQVSDPMLYSISRTTDKGLDPRPMDGSPAWTSSVTAPPSDGFFKKTDYIGAFGKLDWAAGWSAISQLGILTEAGAGSGTPTDIEGPGKTTRPAKIALRQNYPNPFNPTTQIQYSLPQSGFVTLKVYDIMGREVSTLVSRQQQAGIHNINFDASHLASGVYIYRLQVGNYSMIRKMTLLK